MDTPEDHQNHRKIHPECVNDIELIYDIERQQYWIS